MNRNHVNGAEVIKWSGLGWGLLSWGLPVFWIFVCLFRFLNEAGERKFFFG